MKLKDLKRIQKGMSGELTVMVPDGNGFFVELESVRVSEMEMSDYNDEEAVLLEGPKRGELKE